MVWQAVVLPGAQMVTVVYSVLMVGLVALLGPPSTTTDTTLEAGAMLVTLDEDPDDGAEPPPHDSTSKLDSNTAPAATERISWFIIESLPAAFRRAWPEADRRGP